MPSKKNVRARIAERARMDIPCAVDGCGYRVQKLGRYCEKHDLVNERNGHPLGKTVRMEALKPYLGLCERYIAENRDNPAIAAGLRWTYRYVYERLPAPQHRRRKARPAERLARFVGQLAANAIHEERILAVVAAMFLLRDCEPAVIKSDRHFNSQLARRVLRLAPAPFIEAWRDGKGGRMYDHLGVRVKELLAEHLITNVGFLALRIARVIKEAMDNNPYHQAFAEPVSNRAGRHSSSRQRKDNHQ